jgi:copper(I)-binding protein
MFTSRFRGALGAAAALLLSATPPLAHVTHEVATRTVAFPIVQERASKAENWIDVAAPGQDTHAPPSPAPAPAGTAPSGRAAVFRAGPLIVEQPWARATPGGAKVGGGYMRITNMGTAPDRLVGGSVAVAGRFEVHEMSVSDNVMRMRPVDSLEVKPGETVELKPGGYHAMFLDLKAPLKVGDRLKGTLVFEKAGPIEVEYAVRGIAAQSAGEGDHQH